MYLWYASPKWASKEWPLANSFKGRALKEGPQKKEMYTSLHEKQFGGLQPE